ncbi:OmpA family protein [Flavobacterium sp. LC2016-23]|uniref:OmpA family protein n=1 Tax=Flavobacterium sp. LC2016-23 TaxID=2666330 RepID=UPI0012AF6F99|nr:OmpA family protein [Flavobacterium sp. LC2016-23]MRX41964.1 OmpA family protein [Flavobacterium sp. LC2016-23]
MKTRTFLLLFLSATFFAFSQESKIRKANEKYDNLAYIDAIEIYKKVAERGYKSKELFQKLGNSYYFNGQLPEANKWYTQLFKMNTKKADNFVNPEYYYRYSQTLKSAGNQEKADEYLNLFAKQSENEIRAKLYINNKDYLEEIKMNSGRYTLQHTGINTMYSEYGAAFFKNNFVFASSRINFKGAKKRNKWDNQAYTNLLVSKVGKDGTLGEPQLFSKKLSSKFNESTPVFTKDGKTVYFTRNNYLNGKIRKSSDDVILLKIYKASYRNGEWQDIKELPFNSNEYSVAHPALSPDEKTLYFASNMPGTLGQSDLFKVKIYQDDSYSKPENLGPEINTEERETFPFVSEDNKLYFSSSGQLGLGGLDIYVSQINPDGSLSRIVNLGEPVNSSFDDFCYYVNPKSNKGFFSSNRNMGLGFDDIYKFTEDKPLQTDSNKTIDLNLIDKETNYPIPNAAISLFDEKMNLVAKVVTNDLGSCKLDQLKAGKTYYIRAESEDFETIEKSFFTNFGIEKKPFILPMGQKMRKLEVGVDLAKLLNFSDIYFDVDKAAIREDAVPELAKVAEFMKLKPNIIIDVRAHTDSRQSAAYNLKLSNLRAQSTVDWLVKEGGIDRERLSGRGYGEMMILNKCVDGISCTEEEHAINRRSEFIIVGFIKK